MTDQTHNYKNFTIVKTDSDTAGYIKGIATTPALDSYDDIIATGAFAESINKRGVAGPRSVKMLAQHDTRYVIGNWKSLSYVGDALHVEGLIDLENQKGQEYYSHVKKDQIGSLSVGFRTIARTYNEDTLVRTITKGDLREISLVTFPANEEAVITTVKSLLGSDSKLSEIEKKIAREFGLSRNQSSAVIREIRRVGLIASAPGTPAVPGVPSDEEKMELARKEQEKTAHDFIKDFNRKLEQQNALAEIRKLHALLCA